MYRNFSILTLVGITRSHSALSRIRPLYGLLRQLSACWTRLLPSRNALTSGRAPFFIPIHMASPRGFSHNSPEFPTVSPDNIKHSTYLTRNYAAILITPLARNTCIADHISWSSDILSHLLATLTALIPSDGAVNPFYCRNIHQIFLITAQNQLGRL